MKRWKIITFVLLTVYLLRTEHTGVRVDRLDPVETVQIRHDGVSVVVETDTGAKGIGTNLDTAVKNLKTSASSTVFLDTTRYILVDSRTEGLIPQLYEIFRPSTQVCRIRTDAELTELTQYLKHHRINTSLLDVVAAGKAIPTLYYQEGRGQLVQ